MTSIGQHTHHEIFSQPAAWAATLATLREHADDLLELYQGGRYDAVAWTGCGSPYYAMLSVAALMQELGGAPASAVPASEIWLNRRAALPARQRALLVAASRSGSTTEVLRAVEAFRADGGDAVTLTSFGGRPLGALGTRNLTLAAGEEQSLAQTRAFTTLLLGATALAALWSGRDDLLAALAALPEACERLLASYAALARELGGDASLDRFYFLGSGPRYGLACELALKMKEMSLSHSEPFHVLEFRHGPQTMVTPGALVVALLSESSRAHEEAVVRDMRQLGGRVLTIGERDADVSFASGLPEAASGALYLPFGQLLAYERALSRGYNPDLPHNLSAVVTLDDAR
jgi:glucosamine--fructose-6-phosphate aminotransferase (isomerizing)